MGKPKHDAEEYRVICIILVIIIAFMGFMWYRSEEYRIELVHELEDSQEKVEELKEELYEAWRIIENPEEQ